MKHKAYIKLIIVLIALVIIIAGTVVKLSKGMNYIIKWKKSVSINFHIHEAKVELSDLKGVLNESFPGSKYIIQNLDDEEDDFLITIDKEQITDEEKNSFIEKVNSKYETEITADDIEVVYNNPVKLFDIAKPYIIPVIITVVIISAYFILRYKKVGALNIIENLLYGIVMPEWLYLSILALFRISVGYYTLPIAILIYLISIITLIYVFEKQAQNVEPKNNKKR